MVKIFTVLYGDFSQPDNGFTPYYNRAKDKLYRFENNPILDIVDNYLNDVDPNDWVGVFSPKFPEKTKCDNFCVNRGIRYASSRGLDVVNYSPALGNNIAGRGWNFMEWSEDGHKGITELIKACCESVGMHLFPDARNVIYANQFVARKRVYVDFVESMLRPSIALMEGPLWDKVNIDPGYTRSVQGIQYNMLTFVCERLFMQYAENNNLKVLEWN